MQCLRFIDHGIERIIEVGDFMGFYDIKNADIAQNIYYNQ